ncbi:hypothetical protein M0813_03760 [Anaeramoeba flamelloides]|uniref:Uncharacterized protein n=1 Tax=Anaeramoeba flamelloides TaxID=1746091 RepID=A0ABQ8XSM6_9EUKA|nr:hypothetical protein M0813_03760 [Anaeramoeba flamelloides]
MKKQEQPIQQNDQEKYSIQNFLKNYQDQYYLPQPMINKPTHSQIFPQPQPFTIPQLYPQPMAFPHIPNFYSYIFNNYYNAKSKKENDQQQETEKEKETEKETEKEEKIEKEKQKEKRKRKEKEKKKKKKNVKKKEGTKRKRKRINYKKK